MLIPIPTDSPFGTGYIFSFFLLNKIDKIQYVSSKQPIFVTKKTSTELRRSCIDCALGIIRRPILVP